MSSLDTKPMYNLKVVLQETGIKPDTLRAWERRYGLPQPDRTGGGHRLYARRDIEMIKWLLTKQEEGLSISKAVQLYKSVADEGQDPLENVALGLAATPRPAFAVVPGAPLEELRRHWIEACLAFDETTAENIASQAFALYSPDTVCFELLLAGLANIGESWYQGKSSVQQEHFASALVIRRLNALIAASPPPTRPATVLIGCPAEEDHVLAALILTFLLRQRGWKVIYLGANVPIERFAEAIVSIRPRLLILVAQQLHTAASLLETASDLQPTGIPLAFGGLIFNRIPRLQQAIPGYFLGSHLQNAPEQIEKLITSNVTAKNIPEQTLEQIQAFQPILQQYRAERAAIESEVSNILQNQHLPYEYLNIANRNLAQEIDAALRLGNLEYIGVNIDWLKNLIQHHHAPLQGLKAYLQTYQQVVARQLGESGGPITDWLAEVLARNGF